MQQLVSTEFVVTNPRLWRLCHEQRSERYILNKALTPPFRPGPLFGVPIGQAETCAISGCWHNFFAALTGANGATTPQGGREVVDNGRQRGFEPVCRSGHGEFGAA